MINAKIGETRIITYWADLSKLWLAEQTHPAPNNQGLVKASCHHPRDRSVGHSSIQTCHHSSIHTWQHSCVQSRQQPLCLSEAV